MDWTELLHERPESETTPTEQELNLTPEQEQKLDDVLEQIREHALAVVLLIQRIVDGERTREIDEEGLVHFNALIECGKQMEEITGIECNYPDAERVRTEILERLERNEY